MPAGRFRVVARGRCRLRPGNGRVGRRLAGAGARTGCGFSGAGACVRRRGGDGRTQVTPWQGAETRKLRGKGAARRLFPALTRWANFCRAYGADGLLRFDMRFEAESESIRTPARGLDGVSGNFQVHASGVVAH
jgi:hypothetical protein